MVVALRAASTALRNTYAKDPTLTQVSALCYREAAEGMEILLITSSNGRWILPKGWPMEDRCDAKAARQEAWEEAGVKTGDLEMTPVGSYVGMKAFDNGATALCDTTVYAIEVSRMVADFPEAERRDRKWVSLAASAEAVDDPDLADFLRGLELVAQ